MENYTQMQGRKYRKKKPSIIVFIGNFLFTIILLAMVAYIAFNLTYKYRPVEGISMSPTLNRESDKQDGVYINLTNKCDIGDVIIAKNTQSDILVIKRLVATGGDKVTITFSDGFYHVLVIRKGTTIPIEIDYSFLGGITEGGTFNDFNEYCSTHINNTEVIDGKRYLLIPENYIYYLGDNMGHKKSEDCADRGPVSADNLVGKVRFIIYGRTSNLKQIIEQIFRKPDCL